VRTFPPILRSLADKIRALANTGASCTIQTIFDCVRRRRPQQCPARQAISAATLFYVPAPAALCAPFPSLRM